MSLRLIGAGFGRTGTLSLKSAIEKLGAGPCYHMLEVAGHAGHAAQWQAAAEGHPMDWDALFAGFEATVDWPACRFWRELARQYPEARVLLSVRDSERWYKSVRDTIYQIIGSAPDIENEQLRQQMLMGRRIVFEDTFEGRFEDAARAIEIYERHNEAVVREIPADRLLVYEVGAGWEPLCNFLGRPVPTEDFPHVNTTREFQHRIESFREQLRPGATVRP